FLHAQGNLNLNATTFTDSAVVKTGAGTLNVGAGAFNAVRGSLQIDGGTVTLGANNTFPNVRSQTGSTSGNSLYINGGTLDLGGNSQMINVLGNNNELPGSGGTVTSASPAALTVTGGGRFSGTVAGAISIDKTANNTLLFASPQTYTGTTTVRSGTLLLRDSGSIASTGAIGVQNATLQFDNGSLSNVVNRVPAAAPVTLFGGTVNLTGAAGQVASQTLNSVTIAGGRNDITGNAGGSGAAEVNIGNLVRALPGTANSTGAVLNVQATYGFLGTPGNNTTAFRTFVTNVNGSALALNDGIIGGWAVTAPSNGNAHFATYIPSTGIGAMSNTADGFRNYDSTDVTAATATQNVNDATARTLTVSKTVNSLRTSGSGITHTFNTGVVLTIDTGGLLHDAGGTQSFSAAAGASGMALTSNSGELVHFVQQNTTGLNIPIIGAIDLVKAGGGSTNVRPEGSYTVTNTSGSNAFTTASTVGLVVGQPISGTGIPAGAVIATVPDATNFTISANTTAAVTTAVPVFGNTYTGKTFVNGGTMTLNLGAAGAGARTAFVAIPGDLVINAATVTEANVPNQISSGANVTLSGGGRLNLYDGAAGITETLRSVTFLDGSSGTATTNLDRANTSRPTSVINLTAPVAITATNTNPSAFGQPFVGGFAGTLGFTNATGSTLNITSPVQVNGVLANGLRVAARIGNVPTGVSEGGLIKDGPGLLVLAPDQNQTFGAAAVTTSGSNVITGLTGAQTGLLPLAVGQQVTGTNIPNNSYIVSVDSDTQITISSNATASGTGITVTGLIQSTFGNPATPTEVFNIKAGVVRADTAGALGRNNAITTVQSGAVLLGANSGNQVITGSVTLKAGSTLGATLNAFTLGAATLTPANQTTLNVPSGTVNVAAYDYFVPATNNGNITVNARLTGAGTINIDGPRLTQGAGGGGVITLGNPILTGTGSNDFSGTINVNTNAVLQNQVALIAGNGVVRTTGNAMGTATINLNGGRLRLRDDLSGTTDVSTQTITYGNNVNLTADSYLDANRQTSTTAGNNTINFGTLAVASGTRVLNVDSGNGYRVGFAQLDGAGTLVKGGGSQLNINGFAATSSKNLIVSGPIGLNYTAGANLVLPAGASVNNLTVNGSHAVTGTMSAGTLEVGNNATQVLNGLNGVTNAATVGQLALAADATATTVRNNGQIGSTAAATLTGTTIVGTGVYQTFGQPLTVAGTLADDGAVPTRFKVSGNNVVTLNATASTNTGGAEVNGGVLRIAPTATSTNPLGTGASPIRVLGVGAVSVADATGVTAAAARNGATGAVTGELRFDGGANPITQAGSVTNSGLVRVATGTSTIGGRITGPGANSFAPGLLEGALVNTGSQADFTAARPVNPGNFGLRSEPRFAQQNLVTQNPLTGWGDNTTWAYSGQFKSASPTFSFAENIDDITFLSIDGVVRINNGTFNQVTSSAFAFGQTTTTGNQAAANSGNGSTPAINLGMGPAGDGWHNIEVRFNNGGGGAGPVVGNGFFNNFGFGVNMTGAAALDGTQYLRPIDPGDGSLFRTAVAAKGDVTLDNSTGLTIDGMNNVRTVTLGSAAANPAAGDAVLTISNAASAAASDAEQIVVSANLSAASAAVVSLATGVGAGAVLNLDRTDGTVGTPVDLVNVAAGRTLRVTSTGTGVLRVGTAANSQTTRMTLGASSVVDVQSGTLLVNTAVGSSGSGAAVNVASGARVGGVGSITATLNAASNARIAPGD
ncbi:MAG TPA: hypothetical protein VF796_21455, partial [Humisphaera sp.]